MESVSAESPARSRPTLEDNMANALRFLAADAVQRANSGHPGMPMGMADVATVLFSRFLKFDASRPDWPDRDRFVLSAGHGSMLLYGLLHLTGYAAMTLDEIKNFRQLGSRTAGHPEYGAAPGIETTTGPLGQGFGNAVGMAVAERHLAARFGSELVDHFTYAIAGDGCLMEGIGQEALSLAGHLGLGRLILLFDDNHISIDGPTDLTVSEDHQARFAAAGWDVAAVDGHDREAVAAAIARAREVADRPSLIACRTVIGYGAPTKAGTAATHGAPLGEEEIAGARAALDWPYEPFEIPDDVRRAWADAGRRGEGERHAWESRVAAADAGGRATFERALAGDLPADFDGTLDAYKKRLAEERPGWATRKASQETLEVFAEAVPEMIGGSADLTGSNNTRAKCQSVLDRADYGGRYIYYGVREHAMAAAMNGLALHGGVIPYGGTFMVFADYLRPSLRLSALMGQRVVYVLTHDSIGLGEDGPTHQPVEHLAALRAIPGVHVLRPADAVETAECWALALTRRDGPSAMILTRQGLPAVRTTHRADNLCARGAYVLSEAEGARRATILATGSEIELALAAQEALRADGIETAVVSMPCWERFEDQDAAYRAEVLGAAPRVAVEAGVPFGWTRYVADEAAVIGMHGFGASAPAKDLFAHFGITAAAVADAVRQRI